jgi:ParB family chromosome partitioning protein
MSKGKHNGAAIIESLGIGRQARPPATSSAPRIGSGFAGSDMQLRMIPVAEIIPDPKQPRRRFDAGSISRLAATLKKRGVLQPLGVRYDSERKKYILRFGERRYRAAKEAGLKDVPCRINDAKRSDGDQLVDQLVENVAREDLAPMDLARGLAQMIGLEDLTEQQAADELGLSVATVSRHLALLKQPRAIQELVEQERLSASTAYALAKIANVKERIELATDAANEGWSRAQVERFVTDFLHREKSAGDGGHESRSPASQPASVGPASSREPHPTQGAGAASHRLLVSKTGGPSPEQLAGDAEDVIELETLLEAESDTDAEERRLDRLDRPASPAKGKGASSPPIVTFEVVRGVYVQILRDPGCLAITDAKACYTAYTEANAKALGLPAKYRGPSNFKIGQVVRINDPGRPSHGQTAKVLTNSNGEPPTALVELHNGGQTITLPRIFLEAIKVKPR